MGLQTGRGEGRGRNKSDLSEQMGIFYVDSTFKGKRVQKLYFWGFTCIFVLLLFAFFLGFCHRVYVLTRKRQREGCHGIITVPPVSS